MKSFVREILIKLNVFLVRKLKINQLNKFNDYIPTNEIIVIAPHPDDEIIGLGGFILRAVELSVKVHLVYLTDGEGSGVWSDSEEIGKQRISMSERVCGQLGITSITRFYLPDGILPLKGQNGFSESVKQLTELIDYIKPDAVFATSPTDYWPFDHVACSDLAVEAVENSKTKPTRWFYWVWAWYHIRPWQMCKLNFSNLFKIDIAEQLEEKKKFMEMYLKPTTPDGKPWSGVLPEAMLYPFTKPVEIVEKYEYLTQMEHADFGRRKGAKKHI